jgi:hypothetical protein
MYFANRLTLVAVLLLYFAPTAFANAFHTGADLARSYKAFIRLVDPSGARIYSDVTESDLCARYADGAIDAFDTVQGLSWGDRAKWICAPDNMQLEQAVRVFLKYTDDHPEDLHYSAANAVWLALHRAFPCPAK